LKAESAILKPANPDGTRRANIPQVWLAPGVCVFLVLAVLGVFAQTARFDFINYDDGLNVSQNPVVRKGLSVQAVGWAFAHPQAANWVPLTTLSHILDCQLFGLHAGGHHLVNVFWHAASAVLLFLVLRRMTGALWRSAFVAAVFAVHPLRAESVAWVSERKDVLSAFFFMLTIGAYVRFVEKRKEQSGDWNNRTNCAIQRGRRFYYTLALVFFALGLMAKSMVATLPFVLLLLDYWPLGRMGGMKNLEFRMQNGERGEQGRPGVPFWGLVREKIPMFAMAAAVCVATALMPGMVLGDAQRLALADRVGNALVSYGVYLRQMIFPARLAIPYPIAPTGQPPWKVCLALVILAAISAGVIAFRKKRPCLLTGWLWYLGMLVPVIGILQISKDSAHADRYTYLPQIGLALAGTWAVADWSAGWKYRREILGALMTAVIAALMVSGHRQTSYWKDSESLWTHTLSCTSSNMVACDNLAADLAQKGRLNDAIAQYQNALEIAPDDEGTRNNLGAALFLNNDLEGAIAQYRKVIELNPAYENAHCNLGIALARKGNVEEAIAQYREALDLKPDDESALRNLGDALLKSGQLDEAPAQYRKALDLNAEDEEARSNLGRALLQKGDLEQAIVCYQQTLKLNPRSADAYDNLGLAYFKKSEIKRAVDAWQQALQIKPDQLYVLNNLAWLLATTADASLRDGAKAVALAKRADQLSGGGDPMILHTLAAACAETGSYELAAATARRGLELAVAQKNDALAATLQKEIKLYESGSPARDPAR
jgi:tetratricopeptide (TPR) repeat protein